MICAHCREAGVWLVRSAATTGFGAVYRALAASSHARCKGGTWCYCAHRDEDCEVQDGRRQERR